MQVKPHAFSVNLPCPESQAPHGQSQECCHSPIESSLGPHNGSENELAPTGLNLIDAFSRDRCKGLGTSCSFGKDLKEQRRGRSRSREGGKSNPVMTHRAAHSLEDLVGMELGFSMEP